MRGVRCGMGKRKSCFDAETSRIHFNTAFGIRERQTFGALPLFALIAKF